MGGIVFNQLKKFFNTKGYKAELAQLTAKEKVLSAREVATRADEALRSLSQVLKGNIAHADVLSSQTTDRPESFYCDQLPFSRFYVQTAENKKSLLIELRGAWVTEGDTRHGFIDQESRLIKQTGGYKAILDICADAEVDKKVSLESCSFHFGFETPPINVLAVRIDLQGPFRESPDAALVVRGPGCGAKITGGRPAAS